MRERLDALRRRATTAQVRVVHIVLGYAKANRYFWVAPRKGNPSWTDVRNRIDWLTARDKAAAADFVHVALERTSSPAVVIALARYGGSREAARPWLATTLAHPAALTPRIERNGLLAGAFAAAARVLLDFEDVRGFVRWLVAQYDFVPTNVFQAMDSVGYRISAPQGIETRMKPSEAARHRLIVTESLDDQIGIDCLLPGAKSATLLATADTYGRADVERFRSLIDGGDITVEHVRSRVTRFSQPYIDLHEATKDLAIRLTSEVLGDSTLIDPKYWPAFELTLADFLFFAAIRVRAIDELLDDKEFDHIVVATNNHSANGAYVRQLAAIEKLRADPRVELVSVSRSPSSLRRFWSLAETIAAGHAPRPAVAGIRVPEEVIVHKFSEVCRQSARRLVTSGRKAARPTALLASSHSEAYNRATAAYVAEIGQAYDVSAVQIGTDFTELGEEIARQPGAQDVPLTFLLPPAEGTGAMRTLVRDRMLCALGATNPGADAPWADRMGWAAADAELERMSSAMTAFLFQLRTIDTWFADMAADGTLPDVVVLTPQRSPGVTAMAIAARMHGVPSVAVEPHMQDANYCRYSKVLADYYGVLSHYFRTQTAAGFGIDIERIRSIGSPRQVAPRDHDRATAYPAARAALAEKGLVLEDGQLLLGFFSQPVAWDAISVVWADFLEAARATGSKVLLKPHPEDAPSRIRQYLAGAKKGEVLVLKRDLEIALDAVDLAMTTFSTVGIDATLRRTPVVVLADGDAAYPVDLPAILDVPVTRSADELIALLGSFQADPTPFTRLADEFLERESQFVTGPGPGLRQLLDDAIARGRDGLRTDQELPKHLFLDGPHPVFLDYKSSDT